MRGPAGQAVEMRDKLAEKLADPGLYDEARKVELEQWTIKFAELEEAEHRAEALWLEAQARLEAAGQA
jgi:ATP-binding cassette subfamily F protein 3